MNVCTICRGTHVVPYATKGDFTFDKCVDCGYVVADPMPSDDDLAELYASEHFASSYHPEESRDDELFQQRQVQYRQDRDLLLEHLPGGRLLDFGCGNGGFLGTFPASFEKVGYEFNRATTGWLHAHADFRVLDTLADVEAEPDGSFDGATMRGVIEHLVDPEANLALAARKLRPGGVFFVCATPNVDSPCALVHGTSWNQFTPPYHLHFFSPRTLSVLAARHGLALVDCRFPYLGTPYATEAEDGRRFVGDAQEMLAGCVPERSAPYPGTMMSLVFRRVA